MSNLLTGLALVFCAAPAFLIAAQPASCAVRDIRYVTAGAAADWSHSGNGLIAFMRRDTAGIYQVFTIRADGAGERCLTCSTSVPGLTPRLHKGSPSWHPNGQWILFQAEIPDHIGPKELSEPGRGWWSNLWVMNAEATAFHQVTSYTGLGASGVLAPRFSRDGRRALWTEFLTGQQSSEYRSGAFGRWRLDIADFVIEGSRPFLRNTRLLAPGDGVFFESQDWSPDEENVIFAADIGRSSPFAMDLYKLNTATQRLVNLTNTDDEWEEQGTFSPNGRRIAFMSSRNNPEFVANRLQTLRAEHFLMDANGGNIVQLTHFNTPGFAEFTGRQSVATKAAWSPDGTQLLMEELVLGGAQVPGGGNAGLWMLTFAGPCGAEP